MSNHDEHDTESCTCEGLLLEMDFKVRAYFYNKPAAEFETWFKTVFSVTNPDLAEDFLFTKTEFEGILMLDITSYNPSFPVEALETLFDCYKISTVESNKPKLLAIRDDLN